MAIFIEQTLLWETLGRVGIYCECVKMGCKPAASIIVRKRHVQEVIETIRQSGCNYRINERSEPDEWADVDIFAYPSLAMVREEMIRLMPSEPTPFFEWAKGKWFGYSDNHIDAYLRGCFSIYDAPKTR